MTTSAPRHDTDPRPGTYRLNAALARRAGNGVAALRPALRALVMTGTSAAAAFLLMLGARGALEQVRNSTSVDLLVGTAVLALGTLAAALLAFGSLTLLITHTVQAAGHAGRSFEAFSDRCTPAALRRVVAVGLGAGLGLLGPAGIAGAAEPDLGWTVTSVSQTAPAAATQTSPTSPPSQAPDSPTTVAPTTPVAVSGPQQPVTQPTPTVAAPTTATADTAVAPASTPSEADSTDNADSSTVTVLAGDSLWSIAAEHLGSASPTDVAARWPRWYAANRDAIGDDPDLIHPGQVLVAPSATEGDA